MHIVLFEPEIPQNTGNIARTCAATGSPLHLVGKLGFSLDDKYTRRAGLDYWPLLTLCRHNSFEDYLAATPGCHRFCLSTKGGGCYTDIRYPPDCHLIFGRETAGLPDEIRAAYPCLRVPMRAEARSLNLANTVALVLYESLRQHGFDGLI